MGGRGWEGGKEGGKGGMCVREREGGEKKNSRTEGGRRNGGKDKKVEGKGERE